MTLFFGLLDTVHYGPQIRHGLGTTELGLSVRVMVRRDDFTSMNHNAP